MNRLFRMFPLFLLSLTSVVALAAPSERVQVALEAQDRLIANAQKGDIAVQFQNALDALVDAGTSRLALSGDHQGAARLKQEWKMNYSEMLSRYQFQEIGDHEPLSKWLENFYKKMRLRLGDTVMSVLKLNDIITLNYAIPVVFHPRGFKGQTWDKLEYNKHFTPFISILSYWGSFFACKAIAAGTPVAKFCTPIASVIRIGMKNWVGPVLSDYVYNKANGKARSGSALLASYYQMNSYYERELAQY